MNVSSAESGSLGIRLAACAAVLGLAAGSSGCEAAPSTPDSHISPQASTTELPDGVCVPSIFDNRELQIKAATSCLTAMEAGRVALVTFGVPAETAEGIADGMEKTIETASRGLIHISITVVPSTTKAQEALDKAVGSRGCIDSTNTRTFASRAADITMPELHNSSDFVIALSDKAACDASKSGAANPKGRGGDIFLGNIEDADRDGNLVNEAAAVGSHEQLHLYRLGHGGKLSGKTPDGSYSELNGNKFGSGGVLDLKEYLATCMYDEYGNGVSGADIMGNSINLKVRPNPIHVNRLLWPKVVLEGEGAALARPMTKEGLVFDQKAASEGRFAILPLSEQVIVQKGVQEATNKPPIGSTIFNNLAIVPLTDESNGVYGAELYMTSNSGNIASLGFVLASSKGKVWQIAYGNQHLEMRLDSKNLNVKLKA